MAIIFENNAVYKSIDRYDQNTGVKLDPVKNHINSADLIAEKEALQRRIDVIDAELADVQTEEAKIVIPEPEVII